MIGLVLTKSLLCAGDLNVAETIGYGYFQLTHIHSDPPKIVAYMSVGYVPRSPSKCGRTCIAANHFKNVFSNQPSFENRVVKKVGPRPIPPADQAFPIFRGGTKNPATNVADIWGFWDGNKSIKVGKTSEEQFEMPIQEEINVTGLAERIELDTEGVSIIVRFHFLQGRALGTITLR